MPIVSEIVWFMPRETMRRIGVCAYVHLGINVSAAMCVWLIEIN